jgi:hypothetical protein
VLHPNLSEVYRARVARLREGLEAARALIARVEVRPPAADGHRPRLELVGELSALLAAAGVEGLGGCCLMQTALTILLITAMIGTLVVLALGVVQMVRGDANGKRSNALMQYRVLFQGLAIALFLGLALLLKG